MSDSVALDDVWKLFRETAARQQETDHRIRTMRDELREMGEESDRRIRDVSQQIGNLGSRWGEFVEGLVAPACRDLFAKRGIAVRTVAPRVQSNLPGKRRMEIDLLVINRDSAVLVEVKSRLRVDDVQDHVQRLAEFKEFFKEYRDYQVMGAVAGIAVDTGVESLAIQQGLFVIVQSGEMVRMANELDFVPRKW